MTPVRPRLAGSPADAMARFIQACGGVETVADFINRSPSTVYAWTNPDQSEGAPFALVAQLAAHFGAPEAAEHLAVRSGGVFLPLPEPGESEGKWGELSIAAADETGQLMSAIVRALSPSGAGGSRVTRSEARRLLREIDDLFHVLGRLRVLAEEAAGE